MRAIFLLSICIAILLVGEASGGARYVDDSVSASGDGKSWETAFKKIQEGIDAAWDGDMVIVAEGTYAENVHFHGKDIFVRAFIGLTAISGRNRGPAVTFAGTEGETCVLRGFLIFGGLADYGGGICGGNEDNHTQATVVYNAIQQNRARHSGGGIAYCDGMIRYNDINMNAADERGGGLYCCDGTIKNNDISSNYAIGELSDGGGLSDCFATIENNTIISNHAQRYGGGLAGCPYPIQNNRIIANSAEIYGGGLYGCRGKVRNNTIADNTSEVWGGGLAGCDGTILNCII
jgi:hypothetical protein